MTTQPADNISPVARVMAGLPPPDPGLLTPAEHQVIEKAGQLWNALCALPEDGPTRLADLGELIVHVHAIQHAVMAQAAARAYPQLYRPLGGTLRDRAATGDRPS